MSSEKFQNKYRIKSARAAWHDYSDGNNNAYSYEVMGIETLKKEAGTPVNTNIHSKYNTALPDVDENKSRDKNTNNFDKNKQNSNAGCI